MNLNLRKKPIKLDLKPIKNKSLTPIFSNTPTNFKNHSTKSSSNMHNKTQLHVTPPHLPIHFLCKPNKPNSSFPKTNSSCSPSPISKSSQLGLTEVSPNIPSWLLERSDFQSMLKSLSSPSSKYLELASLSQNKSEEEKKILFEWISSVKYFEKFSKKVLFEVSKKLTRQNFEKGEILIRKQEIGKFIFLIFTGKVAGYNECDAIVELFNSKDVVGDEAFYREGRTVETFTAEEASITLKISRIDFDSIVMNYKKAQKHKNCKLLMKILFFRQWTPLKIQHFCNFLTKIKYDPGTIIFDKGDEANTFFIIKSGSISVQAHVNLQFANRWPTGSKSWKISEFNRKYIKNVCILRPEQYFGESDLVCQQARSYRAVCEDKVVCLAINKADFFEVFSAKDLDYLGKMSFVHLPNEKSLEKMLENEIWEKESNVRFI